MERADPPELTPCSLNIEDTPFEFSGPLSLNPTPRSVITSMAAFALLSRLHLPVAIFPHLRPSDRR